MAGPIVFWPNRKSGLGLRVLSRVPRSLRQRFFTTPPIAKDDDMKLDDLLKSAGPTDPIGMIRTALAASPRLLGEFDRIITMREELVRSAEAARDALREARTQNYETKAELAKFTITVEDVAKEARILSAENERLTAENEAKTADLRRLQKEVDPDEVKLRIMYAVDDALEKASAEKAALRQQLSTAESEIAELKRSKKRLREALDRLAKQT